MAIIGSTAAESSNLGGAIWGRPEIDGRMLCQMCGINYIKLKIFIQVFKWLSAIS